MTMNKAFENKLNHSIELLRKAERIALKYDSENGFYLAFSGGKDSQALYHVAKLAGVKFKAHMSLTSVDPPQVIRFLKKEYPDVVLHKPKMSIFQDAIERKILPTRRVRWCCADFKESAEAGKVTLIGIRAAESSRRAKRHEVEVTDKKFSGNLDEFEEWSKQQIEKQQKKSKRKINEDEFSVKSDNEVRCINGKDSILVSPIFQWTDKDVWYFLNEVVRVSHCSLYDEGYTRIGCILCPMSTTKSKLRDIKRFPHVKRNWIKAIKAIRAGGGIRRRIYLVEHPDKVDGADIAQRTKISHKGLYPPPPCKGKSIQEKHLDTALQDRSSTMRADGAEYSPPPEFQCQVRNTGVHPTRNITSEHERCSIFSDSPTSDGVDVGQYTEDEIAEAIFDWWISGKPYKQWYAEKYLQYKINFDNETDSEI